MGGPAQQQSPNISDPAVTFTGPAPTPSTGSFSVAGWPTVPQKQLKENEIAGYVKGKRNGVMELDPVQEKELISLLQEAKKEGISVEFFRGEDRTISFSVKRKGDGQHQTIRESTKPEGLEDAKELLKGTLNRLLHKDAASAARLTPEVSFTGPEPEPNREPQSPAAWGPAKPFRANEIPGIDQSAAARREGTGAMTIKLDPQNKSDADLIRLVGEAHFWGISCEFQRGPDGSLSFEVKRKGTADLPTIKVSTEGARSLQGAKEQLREKLESVLGEQPGRVVPSRPFSPAGYDISGLK